MSHQGEVKKCQEGPAPLPLTNVVCLIVVIEQDAHRQDDRPAGALVLLPLPSHLVLLPQERESKRASGIIYESYAKKKPDHRVGGTKKSAQHQKIGLLMVGP